MVCALDRVVIDDHDPITKYTFTVDVGTAGGKLRGTLGAGQCIKLCFAATLTCIILYQLWANTMLNLK